MAMPSDPNSLEVFISNRENTCNSCKEELAPGAFVVLSTDRTKVLCLVCADFDHLVYLPSGDSALTRRSRKHSTLSPVVLKYSKARKRNERQGVLVEPKALEKAEQECEADAPLREKRRAQSAIRRAELDEEYIREFAQRVREHYPSCPKGRGTEIAEHACQKYSGRVGRSAFAKEFDESAINLAVVAHIRHAETNYDDLLIKGCDRQEARNLVGERIDEVMAKWRG